MRFANKILSFLILAAILHAAPAWAQSFYGQPIQTGNSTATEASHIIKASPGVLYSITATNTTAAAGYVLLIDGTTDPSDGDVIPVACYAIAANQTISVPQIDYPDPFNTGIVAVFSSTGCNTKTESASAWFRWQVM